jgi:hypothetical protein
MYLSLFTAKHRPPRTYSESSLNFPLQESPRWIASKGYVEEDIADLAYLRREPHDSPEVRREFAEIEVAIREEFICVIPCLRDGNFRLGTPGRPILSWLPESTVS